MTFYFGLGERTFNIEATGRERTEQALDSTDYILNIIMEKCPETLDERKAGELQPSCGPKIIGELQFCYLTGMLVGNFRCMEQW